MINPVSWLGCNGSPVLAALALYDKALKLDVLFIGALSWWACATYSYMIHLHWVKCFWGTYMLGWCGKGIRLILNRVAILDSWNCSLVKLCAYYLLYKQELIMLFRLCCDFSKTGLPFLSVLILWGSDNDCNEICRWMILIHWQISQCWEEEKPAASLNLEICDYSMYPDIIALQIPALG